MLRATLLRTLRALETAPLQELKGAVKRTAETNDVGPIHGFIKTRFAIFPVKAMPFDPTNPSDGRTAVDDQGRVKTQARAIAAALGGTIEEGSPYHRVLTGAVLYAVVLEASGDDFDVGHFKAQLLHWCAQAAGADNPEKTTPSTRPPPPPPRDHRPCQECRYKPEYLEY